MIKFVNAKINLGLKIGGKRPDGYHDLSTVFYPIGIHAGSPSDPGRLADVIEITFSDKDMVNVAGMPLDCSVEQNLVYKALTLFRKEVSSLPPVCISLEKQIPSQAGLGGGSADASFTLLSLNEMAGSPLSQRRLMEMALVLGADCPFFILNKPCIASGVGEILSPIQIDLAGKWAAVVKPAVAISTREAFRHVSPSRPDVPIEDIVRRPLCEWRDLLVNDFETSVFAIHPDLCKIKECLYDKGALYASMSGSGSAFYGIFASREEAMAAIQGLAYQYVTVAQL